MKIGIFGGTFNPPHIGHLVMLEQARVQFGLDKIIILPTGKMAYKEYSGEVMAAHRTNMVKLCCADNPFYEISDYEMTRTEVNYTYMTLDHFREIYPESTLYFIIGGDSLGYFDTWREPGEILKKAVLVSSLRDDYDEEAADKKIAQLKEMFPWAAIEKIHTPIINISSHDIRERVSSGESFRYMVTDKVYDYIRENNLYLGE